MKVEGNFIEMPLLNGHKTIIVFCGFIATNAEEEEMNELISVFYDSKLSDYVLFHYIQSKIRVKQIKG